LITLPSMGDFSDYTPLFGDLRSMVRSSGHAAGAKVSVCGAGELERMGARVPIGR